MSQLKNPSIPPHKVEVQRAPPPLPGTAQRLQLGRPFSPCSSQCTAKDVPTPTRTANLTASLSIQVVRAKKPVFSGPQDVLTVASHTARVVAYNSWSTNCESLGVRRCCHQQYRSSD